MRMILLSIIILSLSLGVSGQATDKEKKKLEKQQAEALKKQRGNDLKSITISLRSLVTFPNSYLDRQWRVQQVIIGEIQPHTDQGKTWYLLEVADRRGEASTLTVPTFDGVVFFAEEHVARAISERSGYKDLGPIYRGNVKPIVDLLFTIKSFNTNGQRYYFAGVSCVVFAGLKGGTVGQC